MTLNRPPPTAIPMTGNSGAPLEHLASLIGCGAKSAFASWNIFFVHVAEGARPAVIGPRSYVPLAGCWWCAQ
jgi:hypothetical protein